MGAEEGADRAVAAEDEERTAFGVVRAGMRWRVSGSIRAERRPTLAAAQPAGRRR
ncbi:hypothetical protein [Streptomyces cyaneofuscatus]|uniref:hypothetical protein n=1 Tax=Streptomyces cyaneofuscatus TaxID=66883 RepID=UPI0036536094